MIKKTISLVLLFVLSLAVFLVATLPANFVWQHIVIPNTKVLSVGIQARAFEGTVWQGRAYLSFRHLDAILDWDIGVAGLFSGSLPLDMELQSTTGKLSSSLELGINKQRLSIHTLDLELEPLNVFTKVQRVTVSGDVFAKNIELVINEQKLESASGSFTWSGGPLVYPAGRDLHDRVLPAFSGRITTESPFEVSVGMRDQDASFDTMRGSINAQGDALWEVTRRVLDVAGEPWSENSKETDVVFKVKKPIYSDLSK